MDIKPQPRYPFAFLQADAMTFPLEGFDFIWASPPCQGYSIMRNLPWLRDKAYPLLIDPVRERLRASGAHYTIENVMGAKLDAWWLCGGMFGLPFYRHRAFETNFFWMQPGHPRHQFTVRNGRKMGARARDIVHSGVSAFQGHGHRAAASAAQVREILGVPWMHEEYTQAIPPAYSEYIARQLTPALNEAEA